MSVTELPHRASVRAPSDTADRASRWQPSRAGILNVWRYYDETFTFHHGKLLLRGANGTGKSKALEVLLPFLLDASLRPNRLSTFGGTERTMHWNLMGEGATGKTRVGYVWLEFTRAADSTTPPWFTCGARLQASVHTTGVQVDYFTSTRRVDQPGGLPLVNDAGQPLSRAALADALQGNGVVHDSAAEYKHRVRTSLFPGLSEQRYDAMITALLQLRTPKLSERLDPSLLSTLLSRALPPLGQGEITELAEGFERLDRQRDYLRTLDTEVGAAAAVATQQRGYAQRVLRAGAAALISATTEMDNRTRDARSSKDELDLAVAERTTLTGRRTELEHTIAEVEGSIEGLEESDAYQQGKELDELSRRTEQAQRSARQTREKADRQSIAADRDEGQARQIALRVEQQSARVQAAREDTLAAARRAALESLGAEVRTALDAPGESEQGSSSLGRAARGLVRGAVSARRKQISQARSAIDRHEHVVAGRTSAESRLEGARTRLTVASTERDAKARAYDRVLEDLSERLHRWATAECGELRIDDPVLLADAAADERRVLDLVDSAARAVDSTILSAQTMVQIDLDQACRQRDSFAAQLEQLAREVDLPPDPPHTRTTDRSTMAGAPLWQLLAFRDNVPLAAQAGIEAALEASGLLDAWMTPDGSVGLPGHDTRIDIGEVLPASAPSLAEVLAPEPGAAVPAERVTALLERVAYGPVLPTGHPAAIASDGSWRLAVASGTWAKAEAGHIGAAARERARRRQADRLTALLNRAGDEIGALERKCAALGTRRTRLEADLASRPGHREADQARTALEQAQAAVQAREETARDAVGELALAEKEVAAALRDLAALSAAHALPTERAALDRLADALEGLREQADVWVDTHLQWSATAEALSAARGVAAKSRAEAEESGGDAERAESGARGLSARLEAVESTVGEDYRQTAGRISELRRSLARIKEDIAEASRRLLQLEGRIGELTAKLRADDERRSESVTARDSAALRLRRLCLRGLPDDAGITVDLAAADGTRATQEAARDISAAWPNLPHESRHLGDALKRLLDAVHTARASFGGRVDLDLDQDEDVHLLTATVDGIRTGAAGLLSTLTEERDRSRDDITAAESELFDRTLTGDTRRHLAARIRQAGELVERMNQHLEQVRTASKVAVQLVWQIHPDLPAGTRAARELLLKDPARITDADREALHTFFRGRIEEAKAKNTAASWEEQLGQVLDYTSWHQFVVKLDRANGTGWQLLTKKLHGALSGGEKAIALHLPLFAAVAAHYEAVPQSPRLILLDEVFVGVDTTNRGQVFALLTALDLDLVLTSDHEWCTYQELPGIAIHQLISGGDGDDAVTSARFTWTGSELRADDPEEALT